jgi:hypothetical protein
MDYLLTGLVVTREYYITLRNPRFWVAKIMVNGGTVCSSPENGLSEFVYYCQFESEHLERRRSKLGKI